MVEVAHKLVQAPTLCRDWSVKETWCARLAMTVFNGNEMGSKTPGTNVRKPNEYAVSISSFIPENHASARINTGFVAWIVIPVVVGSSPISHPR